MEEKSRENTKGSVQKYFLLIIFISIIIFGKSIDNACAQAPNMWGYFFFRCNVGQNSLNWGWGGCDPYAPNPECDNLVIGCSVAPITSTVLATNLLTGYSLNIYWGGGGVDYYEFGRRFAYHPDLTSPWRITATVDDYTSEIYTHAVGAVQQMPFLENVQLIGTGLTPTISWTVPSDAGANRLRLNVIDRNTGLKLWWSNLISIENTSASIAEGVLQEGHPYLIRAMVEKTLHGTLTGPHISRAESYFEFTPLKEGGPDQVFLPTVGPDPDPTDEFGAAFTYNFDVEEGVPCFIDPFVAIGYEYEIGAEDTLKFATVTLPELEAGDNLFDLYLYDGIGWYLARKDLPAGEVYDFGESGADAFRVLGIAKAAELDPVNTTAFITELTFTASGRFTGTQTPIVVYIDEFGSQLVTIDIKPGSDDNPINPSAKGLIPVAIFASVALDAKTIDVSSVEIGDEDTGWVTCIRGSVKEDINGNGLPDLVVHFRTQDLKKAGLLLDGKTLYVQGILDDGTHIIGSDVIKLVGKPQ